MPSPRIDSLHARFLLLVAVFLSGASGLVSQIVWQRYLVILLGAHTAATAVVLAVFFGGLGAGYGAFGRWSHRSTRNPLVMFALVEAALGLWALLFPLLFGAIRSLPGRLFLSWGLSNPLTDLTFAVLLTGPPSFLMGGTLPLLTQGLSRSLHDASLTHSRIYGWNTLGAGLGALFAGYVLVPMGGLVPALAVGGSISLAVALLAAVLPIASGAVRGHSMGEHAPGGSAAGVRPRAALLVIALLSGFYVLALETIIIRLMGLAAGPSPSYFTLTVAVFILALGLGSLLIRRVADYSWARLFWNQVAAAAGLLIVYWSADAWPYGVHRLRAWCGAMHSDYDGYQVVLGSAVGLLLIPPVACCGVTLPLCFHLGKDREHNLGVRVGWLYGVNSVGTVLGALIGGYALLRFVDLDVLFKLCIVAILATAAAAWSLRGAGEPGRAWGARGSFALLGLILFVTAVSPSFVKERFFSPFRLRELIPGMTDSLAGFTRYLTRSERLLYHRDGPDSTVAIAAMQREGRDVARSLYMNGKGDGNTSLDLFTFSMLGHIPALLSEHLERAAVIGLGTGITAATLARYEGPVVVDVAEISNTLLRSASLFDDYNGALSRNPSVHLHGMDAFRFLVGTPSSYDVIVSMPSNPWVVGVENLFSVEAYALAKAKLRPGGLFAQWVQTYGSEPEILKMILRTMRRQFASVTVFQLQRGGDLLLLGGERPLAQDDLRRAADRLQANEAAARHLEAIGVTRLETLLALEIVPPALAAELAGNGPEHRLERPLLSRAAARANYRNSFIDINEFRRRSEAFHRSMAESLLAAYVPTPIPSVVIDAARESFCDNNVSRSVETFLCAEALAATALDRASHSWTDRHLGIVHKEELERITGLARVDPAGPPPPSSERFKELLKTYWTYNSPLARLPEEPLREALESCLSTSSADEPMRQRCLAEKARFGL